MTRYLLLFFLGILGGEAFAEAFVPPQAYSIDRYEAGWQKNPFTLKTALPTPTRDSFAKDLVLGSVSKIDGSTSVVLINAKTRARIHLDDAKASPSGIQVTSVHFAEKRKDISVELAMGGDTATVRYDDAVLIQLASAGNAKKTGPANPPIPGAGHPGAPPINQPPPLPMQPNGTNANPMSTGAGGSPTGLVPTALHTNDPNLQSTNIPTPNRRLLKTAPVPVNTPR